MRYDGSYKEWESEAERSPFWFAVKFVCGATLVLGCTIAGCVALGVFGTTAGVVKEAATVAREEFGPRALLTKYEWFKDASAALDKKRADVGVYDRRLSSLSVAYEGVARRQWAHSSQAWARR